MDGRWNPANNRKRELPEEYRTCPQDARYQNCNVTNWCFETFCDYHKCTSLLGKESECCNRFKKIYQAICPNDWVRRWEEQMKVGTFPVDFPDGIKIPPRNQSK